VPSDGRCPGIPVAACHRGRYHLAPPATRAPDRARRVASASGPLTACWLPGSGQRAGVGPAAAAAEVRPAACEPRGGSI